MRERKSDESKRDLTDLVKDTIHPTHIRMNRKGSLFTRTAREHKLAVNSAQLGEFSAEEISQSDESQFNEYSVGELSSFVSSCWSVHVRTAEATEVRE